MALLLPLLILLVLGIIQYGIYYAARQGGSDIARDAARRAAVGDPADCAAFRAQVSSNMSHIAGATTTGAIIKRTYTRSDPAVVQVGDTVTVRVAFNSFDLNVPMVPVPGQGRVDITVASRVEFVPDQPETCS